MWARCCVGCCEVVLALGELPEAAGCTEGMSPVLGLLLCFRVAWRWARAFPAGYK